VKWDIALLLLAWVKEDILVQESAEAVRVWIWAAMKFTRLGAGKDESSADGVHSSVRTTLGPEADEASAEGVYDRLYNILKFTLLHPLLRQTRMPPEGFNDDKIYSHTRLRLQGAPIKSRIPWPESWPLERRGSGLCLKATNGTIRYAAVM